MDRKWLSLVLLHISENGPFIIQLGAIAMTITYYFKHKEQKKLGKLVNDPLFQQIVSYFHEQEGEIILRELKKSFPEKNFEQFLEEMIKFRLIRREERRYYLEIPFFKEELTQEERTAADNFVQSEAVQRIDKHWFYGEFLWNHLFDSEEDYFFGVYELSEDRGIPFFEKDSYGNEQLTFVSIHPIDSHPYDLASYFSVMEATSGEDLPKSYQPLQQLIGDVDSQYFSAQAYRIVRAVMKGRRIADKRNIFLETMTLTGDLVKSKEEWQLAAPVIQAKEFPDDLSSAYLETLQQASDVNQRVCKKMQIYQYCLSSFLSDTTAMSYLIL